MIQPDKLLHYNIAYKFGRYGSVFGFILIALILAPGKELCDIFFGTCEWADYKSSVKGAWDGMTLKSNRYDTTN